ncbi:MAG: ribosome silencing factor [bacterium]
MSKRELEDADLVEIISEAALNKKALDVRTLDVRKSSSMVDFVVICSGEAGTQLRAIEKEIDKSLKEHRIKGFRWQGVPQSGWILLDLGSITVHIMGQEERDYYNLEELWGRGAIVYHY